MEADGFQRRDVTYTVTVPRQAKSYEFTEKQVHIFTFLPPIVFTWIIVVQILSFATTVYECFGEASYQTSIWFNCYKF